jgi:sugar phosphate isomerase/epimerase
MPTMEVKSFEQAVRVIKAAARPNASLAIDTLHMVRNGRFAADLAALDPALIGYVQLCDGKMMPPTADYYDEAVNNRMPPGEGEFPLADFLAVLPPDRALSLEVPVNRLRDQGMNATERARLILNAARKFLGEHEPG